MKSNTITRCLPSCVKKEKRWQMKQASRPMSFFQIKHWLRWRYIIRNHLKAIATKQQKLAAATSAAEQNAKIVQENLAGGLASQFEYRLMESTLLETRSAVVTLAYQQKVALAEWDRATGRYFQFSDDTAPNVH